VELIFRPAGDFRLSLVEYNSVDRQIAILIAVADLSGWAAACRASGALWPIWIIVICHNKSFAI